MNNSNNKTPAVIYLNVLTDKSQILLDNKGKAGIYLWTQKESGKRYIGSSMDLSKRFNNYFSNGYLAHRKTSYISNALLHYLHSSFSLAILEYIDTTNLSKAEVRKLILEREQYYLDSLSPEYNLLKEAGSSLGYKHSPETIEKLSRRSLTEEHKRKISEAIKGKNLGKSHSPETLRKMVLASKGKNNKKVFVYTKDPVTNKTILYKCFDSCSDAAKELKRANSAISRCLDNGKLLQKKWLLYSKALDANK